MLSACRTLEETYAYAFAKWNTGNKKFGSWIIHKMALKWFEKDKTFLQWINL